VDIEGNSIKTLIESMKKHCPQDSNTPKALFLRPKNPENDIWFMKQAVGSNTLSGWLLEVCKLLNIQGKRTHHTFRRRRSRNCFKMVLMSN
jgi:hypothetical protein